MLNRLQNIALQRSSIGIRQPLHTAGNQVAGDEQLFPRHLQGKHHRGSVQTVGAVRMLLGVENVHIDPVNRQGIPYSRGNDRRALPYPALCQGCGQRAIAFPIALALHCGGILCRKAENHLLRNDFTAVFPDEIRNGTDVIVMRMGQNPRRNGNFFFACDCST